MSKYKRLSTQSQVYNGATLNAFCESCGEDDCRAFCVAEGEEPQCDVCPVQQAFENPKQYEDIGSPEDLAEMARAKAEDRLVVLPCAVGDIVYVNKKCFSDWYCFMELKPYVRAEMVGFKFGKKGIKMNLRPLTERTANTRYHVFFPLSSIGKTVFLTSGEAETALNTKKGWDHD